MKKPKMILVGAAGQNNGKTLFACKLIERYSPQFPIFGIKVTTITEKGVECPRGGEGCGVCSSLEGIYSVSEEKNKDSNKDTSRLLISGAMKVFWLRVLKEHLKAGLEALFQLIPTDIALVCESNSVRTVVEPGCFLMIKNKNQREFKPSALTVQGFADGIIEFDPERLGENPFDMDLEDIKFIEGKWEIRENAY